LTIWREIALGQGTLSFSDNTPNFWPKVRLNKGKTNMTLTVKSRLTCVQCDATYRELDKHGIEYEVEFLDVDAAALEGAKALGYLQAPVAVLSNEAIDLIFGTLTEDEAKQVALNPHWSGFRPDMIEELARRLDEKGVPRLTEEEVRERAAARKARKDQLKAELQGQVAA